MMILSLLSCLTSVALAKAPSPKPHQAPGIKITTQKPAQNLKLEGQDGIKKPPVEFTLRSSGQDQVRLEAANHDKAWELAPTRGLTISFTADCGIEVDPLLVTAAEWKSEGLPLKLKHAQPLEKGKSCKVTGNAAYTICRAGGKACEKKRHSFFTLIGLAQFSH